MKFKLAGRLEEREWPGPPFPGRALQASCPFLYLLFCPITLFVCLFICADPFFKNFNSYLETDLNKLSSSTGGLSLSQMKTLLMAGWLTRDNRCPLNPSQMTRLQKLSCREGLRSMRSGVSHHGPSLTPLPIITAHHARSWSVLLLHSQTVPSSQMHRKIHSRGPICLKLRQINGKWREPFKESVSDITGGWGTIGRHGEWSGS